MNGDRLLLRYGVNDIRRNKGVNAALLAILVLSAFLMATGAMVMERVLGSVDALFEVAKPPHFLQMHSGDYDQAALRNFADQEPLVQEWLIEDMVGYDGAAISWSRPGTQDFGDLSASLIGNLFVTQNTDFDYLIDQDNQIAAPEPGEVYVPVAYREMFGLEIGDRLGVRTAQGTHSLDVAGFVRDAQMASSLSSATRFLVGAADFSALAAGGGIPEIIVEFRLQDSAQAPALQSAYEAADGLPNNGQAVTYTMIRMINAVSDGLTALALVFVSLLLIGIALLNLRFVIRGSLEDSVHEIGAMKAIGLPNRDITRLYLTKYAAMTGIACVIGGGLAVAATALLTRGVQANYASAPLGWPSIVWPLVALAVVFGVVVGMCWRVLASVRRIDIVTALIHGSTLDPRQQARRAARAERRARATDLSRGNANRLNLRLALLDLRATARQWVLIPIVFALTAVLIILPTNLLTTFSSPEFVTYLGAPDSDIRVDVAYSEDLDAQRDAAMHALSSDPEVTRWLAYGNVSYQTPGEEGWETIRVEVGDYSASPLEFVDGQAPGQAQIALSVANADRYQVGVGDTLELQLDGVSESLTVSGVYQDVTSGGYTAKRSGEADGAASSYVFYADLVEGADPEEFAVALDQALPGASVIPMRAYVTQTLSYVTDAFASAALISLIFGLGVAALITTLFLRLRLARERSSMGVLTALGFSRDEIISSVRLRTLLMIVLGVFGGALLAATLGESLVAALVSLAGLGISQLSFIPQAWLVYLAYPAALVIVGYLGAVGLTAGLRRADASQWLRN
ncbi:MAG: ABC transporter permease [Arachnia sp.]